MCQPPDARTPSERTSLPSGNTAQAASPNNTHVDARNQSHPRAIPNTRTHQRRMRPRCTQRLTPALVSGSWVQCAKFRFGGILTPGRTSAWHHSPEEREKRVPRLGDTQALDWCRFMGSMREISLCGNSHPALARMEKIPRTRPRRGTMNQAPGAPACGTARRRVFPTSRAGRPALRSMERNAHHPFEKLATGSAGRSCGTTEP